MKIALIGDMQYKNGEQEILRRYMTQIASWQPDLAVFMGDMGPDGLRGTKEGMQDCKSLFDLLPCETIALLGNHDVEYRPDSPSRAYTPEKWRQEVFGGETPWRAVEKDGFLILCLSVERQPEEMLLSQHALYSSPEQLSWARETLAAHKKLPTIVISHAPVAGSGLRCCPPVHHRATDAFMGQNFDPFSWKDLLAENPQVLLWCSAHFHMGHGYARAVSMRANTAHVSCGVPASCARDATRQTRLLEIKDGCAELYTMDHMQNGLVSHDLTLRAGEQLPESPHDILIGDDHALRVWEAHAIGRFYIATQAGRLWEYDCALEELSGALCTDEAVQEVSVFCGRIFVRTQEGCFSVPADSALRFRRLSGYAPQLRCGENAMPDRPLRSAPFTLRTEPEGEYIGLGR